MSIPLTKCSQAPNIRYQKFKRFRPCIAVLFMFSVLYGLYLSTPTHSIPNFPLQSSIDDVGPALKATGNSQPEMTLKTLVVLEGFSLYLIILL